MPSKTIHEIPVDIVVCFAISQHSIGTHRPIMTIYFFGLEQNYWAIYVDEL